MSQNSTNPPKPTPEEIKAAKEVKEVIVKNKLTVIK